uniref:Uncharacterized protein n=1 Tax=Fagus sylvatica TaxID=28930 RepID=A0A2N9HT12_FAGSY
MTRRCTSFLMARLSLTVGGVISNGHGCSKDNGFGVFFHIELLSSTLDLGVDLSKLLLLGEPKPESHDI